MLADFLYDLFRLFAKEVILRLVRGVRLLVLMFLGLLWRLYELAVRRRASTNGSR